VSVAAAIIAVAALWHALIVLLINMPPDPIRNSLRPVITAFDGSESAQSWKLFAPTPTSENIHVIVRGRFSGGTTTGWYDVTQFFASAMLADRFTPTRAISEDLAHSADIAFGDRRAQPAATILLRISSAVLKLYFPARAIDRAQIELDAWEIPTFTRRAYRPRVAVRRLPWTPVPHVSY
jgi:hypothetical protein